MGNYTDICPHCSVHLHLEGSLRMCGACGLAFNTVSGEQVSGPRVLYPREQRLEDQSNRHHETVVERSGFQQQCVEDFISGKMI